MAWHSMHFSAPIKTKDEKGMDWEKERIKEDWEGL